MKILVFTFISLIFPYQECTCSENLMENNFEENLRIFNKYADCFHTCWSKNEIHSLDLMHLFGVPDTSLIERRWQQYDFEFNKETKYRFYFKHDIYQTYINISLIIRY